MKKQFQRKKKKYIKGLANVKNYFEIPILISNKLLMCLIYIVILPFITGVQLKSSSNWL
jgi:hypothetical protein